MSFFRFLGLTALSFRASITLGLSLDPQILACLESPDRSQEAESLIENITQIPTPGAFPADQAGGAAFLPSAHVFASLLEIDPDSAIINHLDELRFLAKSAKKGAILAVVPHAQGWSEEKAQEALVSARAQAIKVSLVWLAETPPPTSLLLLVRKSGGHFYKKDTIVISAIRQICRDKYRKN